MFLYMNMSYALKDDTETTRPKFYLRLDIVRDFLRNIGNQKDVHKQIPLATDRFQDDVLRMIERVI